MTKKPFILGIVAQFLQYGAALLMLPFIIQYLSSEELGLWYVFSTILSLSMLVDFGFQPTFARNFSLACSGVNALQKVGIKYKIKKKSPNYKLEKDLLNAAKLVYLFIALSVFFILITVGTYYIKYIVRKELGINFSDIQLAWYLFSFSVALNIYFMWISPFLIGTGNIHKNYIFIITNKLIFTLFTISLIYLGLGLIGLSIGLLVGALLARVMAFYLCKDEMLALKFSRQHTKTLEVLKILWPTTWKMGLTSLSGFLIVRYNLLVVTSFFGLSVAASYGLTLQILMVLKTVAQLLFQINLPNMVRARVEKNRKLLKEIYFNSSFYFFIIFISGFFIVGVYGDYLLQFIGSKTLLIEPGLFYLFAIIIMLEGNHANAALVITTGNNIPFVWSALISGVSVAFFSTLSGFLDIGLLFILLSQGLVQLLYNNWKWPLYVFSEIERIEM